MDEATRQMLLSVNKRFYDEYSDSFGASRQRPWPAWETLLSETLGATSEEAREDGQLRILDVGCGNGRFGVLAADRIGPQISYLGLDQSLGLLAQAQEALEGRVEQLRLQPMDLGNPGTALDELQQAFDIIGIFGVLHHLPGEAERRRLLTRLGRKLAPGGQLWASWWMLHHTERFDKKVVPWDRLGASSPPQMAPDPRRLEEGDTLLSWQRDGFGLRYLHFPPKAEIERLQSLDGLRLVRSLASDGPTGRENLYLVWTC